MNTNAKDIVLDPTKLLGFTAKNGSAAQKVGAKEGNKVGGGKGN